MSQRKIRLIIGAMAIALMGLIAFQAYWLGFMLETKKEQFAADVRSSLDQVVRKLEKQELVILAQKQKNLETQQEKLASVTQKLATKPKSVKAQAETIPDQLSLAFANENLDFQRPFQEEIPNDIVTVRKSFLLPNGQIAEITEQYEVNNQVENYNRRLREEQQLNELFNGNQTKILKEINRLKNRKNKPLGRQREKVLTAISKIKKAGQERIRNLQGNVDKEKAEKQELQKVLKKTEMAKEVFANFLFKERPIEQRFSPSYMDSLIKRELKEKQIHLPYVFGIGSNQKQKPWVYVSAPSMKRPEAQQAAFISPLFPNDLNNTGHVLEVFFPDQKAAERFAGAMRSKLRSGQRGDVIPYDLALDAAKAAEILKPHGVTLVEAAREVFEREYLVAQISRFGGNISRTAEFIGMERSALHRKLKSLGV